MCFLHLAFKGMMPSAATPAIFFHLLLRNTLVGSPIYFTFELLAHQCQNV